MSRSWTKHIFAKNGYCPRYFWEGVNLKIEETTDKGLILFDEFDIKDVNWLGQFFDDVVGLCFAGREYAVNYIAHAPLFEKFVDV